MTYAPDFSDAHANLGRVLLRCGDTAAAKSQLDLIISVETAAAHLAGALGRPCGVLLAQVPAWRWRLDGADSRRYPSVKLLRQTQAGDWMRVIRAAAQGLTQYVKVAAK